MSDAKSDGHYKVKNQNLKNRKPKLPKHKTLPRVSIVVLSLVNQNLYYKILTIKLANQKKELQWRL